jgi:hypothetical protein
MTAPTIGYDVTMTVTCGFNGARAGVERAQGLEPPTF